jgi:anaerobic magnesium-protoporphyrin IX monomethyl ester cyclase
MTVKIVDAYVNNYVLSDLIEIIDEFQPGIIGISVLTPSADVVYGVSKAIRERWPDIRIVMGNMHASLYSDDILSDELADYIVHGEGELTFLNLVRSLESGECGRNVDGISFPWINIRLTPEPKLKKAM